MTVDKIRILYVVDNISFGGGERGFGQLSSSLNRDRFQTYLAAHPGGEVEEIAQREGIPFSPLDMSRRVNFRTIGQLSRVITRNRIDIVHSMGSRADFLARVAAKLAKVPVTISTVAMLVEGYNVNRLKKVIYIIADRFTEKFVDKFIAVSNALVKTLIENHHIPPEKVVRIYNGVELDEYSYRENPRVDLKKVLNLDINSPVVGMIGRFVYQKGYPYLLQAASQLLKTSPNVKFLLVGDGPLKPAMEKLSQELKIARSCIFTGLRKDIPEILSIIDIVVLCSVLEGLPRVIIEAMAMAKPIVTTDISGIREAIVNGKTGILVPPGDPQALAEAIRQLLKNRFEAEVLGREARKRAEEMFDLKRQLALYEEVYAQLLGRSGIGNPMRVREIAREERDSS